MLKGSQALVLLWLHVVYLAFLDGALLGGWRLNSHGVFDKRRNMYSTAMSTSSLEHNDFA